MVSLDITGRVAIITGAAQGLGEEMAMTMAEHGADVVIFDLEQQRELMEAVAAEIREKTGRRAEAVACDVSDEAQVEACVKYVVDNYGKIDILVNNAGYIPTRGRRKCRSRSGTRPSAWTSRVPSS